MASADDIRERATLLTEEGRIASITQTGHELAELIGVSESTRDEFSKALGNIASRPENIDECNERLLRIASDLGWQVMGSPPPEKFDSNISGAIVFDSLRHDRELEENPNNSLYNQILPDILGDESSGLFNGIRISIMAKFIGRAFDLAKGINTSDLVQQGSQLEAEQLLHLDRGSELKASAIGLTYPQIASAAGISRPSIYHRMSGPRKVLQDHFTAPELRQLLYKQMDNQDRIRVRLRVRNAF